jgi:xylulokinase
MTQRWFLAVDLGTGGPKVGAVLPDGHVVFEHLSPVETIVLPGGGAVQDPADYWTGVRAGVGALAESGLVDMTVCGGVGLTGQWASTVPVGAAGRPVGNVMLWADSRAANYAKGVIGGPVSGYNPLSLVKWIRLTGGAPSPNGADPTGHALWFKNEEPEIYAQTKVFLEPVDYLGLCFTGRAAASQASMMGSWLTDNRRGHAGGYVDSLVRKAHRDADKLPPLVPTGSVLGPILDEVADEFGISRGVPVVAGLPDLHTGYLGSGATREFEAHLAISTTSWVAARVPFKRTDVVRQMASVPGLHPDWYLIANNHETAGECLKWFRNSILSGDDGLGATAAEAPSYDAMTAAAATVPVGSGGIIFAPWLNGERSPVDDKALRGSWLNLSLTSSRAAMTRAVLEGVAYNARWLFDAVEKFARKDLPRVRIFGGGAQSDLWCQIHADVLGRPVEQVADPNQTNLRGAALAVRIAIGEITVDEVAGLVAVRQVFEPDPTSVQAYAPIYDEFTKLYAQQKKMYRRLRSLDGAVVPRLP